MALPQTIPEPQSGNPTRQFYDWEERGRGWQIFDLPVVPEPTYVPFPGYYVLPSTDDGRRQTFVSGLLEQAFSLLTSRRKREKTDVAAEEPESNDIESNAASYVLTHEIQICLPSTFKVSKEVCEQFYLSLAYCAHPLAFEIIGLSNSIVIQIVVSNSDLSQVQAQLSAHFPEASVSVRSDFLETSWKGVKGREESAIVEFGLSREFMLPFAAFNKFEPDPFIGITGAMSNLKVGEMALFQVVFQPVRSPWAESVLRAMLFPDGTPFFANDRDFLTQTKTKLSKPLYGAVVRVAASSAQSERSWHIAKTLAGSLSVFADPAGNELIPLENDEKYDPKDHEEDLLKRHCRRSGMILNSDEVVALVHLPSESVRIDKFKRQVKRTKAAPATALNHDLFLGENVHLGEKRAVTLSPEQRVRHTHIIGASGTGKSTLMLNCIMQGIRNGEGLAVLDPHGDLIDKILEYIPEERFNDVIILDPSDEEYVVGFNILSAHSDLEKNLLSSDLVAVFQRLSTSWGDQMTSVMGNAVLAFLESTQGGTLADLRRFLIEPSFRTEFLKTVKDQNVLYYWNKAFPLLSGKPQGPIITRLDTFLRPRLIRHMVSQKENQLNFAEIMNGGKILLAKLSQGAIGEENAYLLGTLLVSKIHQLVMGRQEIRQEKRRDFWLYIDEFHNFVTPSMAAILTGARKYRLGLTLAHHELRQLEVRNSDVTSAVLANSYTRVCFRLGDQDAKKLENGFSFFKAEDMQSLGIGEAICRFERADFDFNLATNPLPKIDDGIAEERRQRIIALSRERYAVPRRNVEIESPAQDEFAKPSAPSREREENRSIQSEIPYVKNTVPPHRPSEAEKTLPSMPVQTGRGGGEHKYLQHLIKRYANDMGYIASIEKPILEGKGNIDVALEREKCSIACQISVTTPVEQEAANVKKCLSAGFTYVAVICTDAKKIEQLRQSVLSEIEPGEKERVRFFSPDQVLSFIQEIAAQSISTEKTVRGYRVKTNYRPGGGEEIRKQAIAQVIVGAIKRIKGVKK